jgi:hypothetical protein
MSPSFFKKSHSFIFPLLLCWHIVYTITLNSIPLNANLRLPDYSTLQVSGSLHTTSLCFIACWTFLKPNPQESVFRSCLRWESIPFFSYIHGKGLSSLLLLCCHLQTRICFLIYKEFSRSSVSKMRNLRNRSLGLHPHQSQILPAQHQYGMLNPPDNFFIFIFILKKNSVPTHDEVRS